MIFMFILQIILIVAIRETTAVPNPSCFNSNWWASFDKKGLSSCNSNQHYITGFYRSKLGSWDKDEIFRLEDAKCCTATSAVYRNERGVCVNANWEHSLDTPRTWSVCPPGYFLNGLIRTSGNNLHNIEQGRCCKPQHHPSRYGQCYDENIRHKFDKAGWTVCTRAGYFVVGLYRDDRKDWLHNIDKFRCCQMTGNPKDTCFHANWWRSFDKQGWSTCSNNQRFIAGFYRSKLVKKSNDPIFNLEEAKCCEATGPYRGQITRCVNANWWTSLDKGGTWSKCPKGYFLNGLYRTGHHNLDNIEEGKCCKPKHHPLHYGKCYEEDIGLKFDKAGWSVCTRAGYFVVGLYRGTGTDWLHNVDKLYCCQMTRR